MRAPECVAGHCIGRSPLRIVIAAWRRGVKAWGRAISMSVGKPVLVERRARLAVTYGAITVFWFIERVGQIHSMIRGWRLGFGHGSRGKSRRSMSASTNETDTRLAKCLVCLAGLAWLKILLYACSVTDPNHGRRIDDAG